MSPSTRELSHLFHLEMYIIDRNLVPSKDMEDKIRVVKRPRGDPSSGGARQSNRDWAGPNDK